MNTRTTLHWSTATIGLLTFGGLCAQSISPTVIGAAGTAVLSAGSSRVADRSMNGPFAELGVWHGLTRTTFETERFNATRNYSLT